MRGIELRLGGIGVRRGNAGSSLRNGDRALEDLLANGFKLKMGTFTF
jgi:hypothetical protein